VAVALSAPLAVVLLDIGIMLFDFFSRIGELRFLLAQFVGLNHTNSHERCRRNCEDEGYYFHKGSISCSSVGPN
jgi:hypothetical protein